MGGAWDLKPPIHFRNFSYSILNMQNREYKSFLLFLTIFSFVTHREIQTVGLPSRTVVDRLAQLICNQSQV